MALSAMKWNVSKTLVHFLGIFFSTALLGTPLVIYNISLQYNSKTKRKKKKKRSKDPKGVGATGLTSHARHRP